MPATAAKKKGDSPAMVAPPLEEPDEQRSASSLPLVSVLPDQGTMDIAKQMLIEASEIRARADTDARRLDEIKTSLVGIADAFGLKGFRWGPIGLEYHGLRTKRTLDKGKLLENGVDAQTIAASYVESKPFVSSRFVPIK